MKKSCWILSDGAAGNRRQAEALAEALQLQATMFDLRLRAPWRWFSPHWLHGRLSALVPALQAPWPALAIGCGRVGAVALDALPRAEQGGPLRVQILNPRCSPTRFDRLIAPAHDGLSGANVLTPIGSLNPIDDLWLQRHRDQHPDLSAAPSPRTLLLVGGPRRHIGFGLTQLRELCNVLEHWQHRDQGQLWISLSRRTPQRWRTLITERLPRLGQVRLWTGPADGANPYAGWVASAERIVVTPDSVNMLSEACATGVPVLSHAPKGVSGRLGELHRSLRDSGRLRPLKLGFQQWEYEPLRETARIAEQVGEMLTAQGRPE